MDSNFLDSLNLEQRRSVTYRGKNLIVLAGAGSGKTRVLTYRISWMIKTGIASPYSIIAVTFTNKAAKEMKERLYSLLGEDANKMWVGTFHGLSHRILRRNYKECGLPENFQVIDSDDQLRIVKKLLKNKGVDDETLEPKDAQSYINKKKDLTLNKNSYSNTNYYVLLEEIFSSYQKECEILGVIDFSDLLLKTYHIFLNNPELLRSYQNRFRYFLVDEFQDTNNIQYNWLHILSSDSDGVTIVGDDDQSIYGWRGAQVTNLQKFQKEFNDVELIKLERNYRSTKNILDAANALIKNNANRMGKSLHTEVERGDPISYYQALNEDDESLYIVRNISSYIDTGGSYKDIAVLYRSNAQSRVIEEAMMRSGIPYVVYGGLRFFERAEIKDVIAYLRLSLNTSDNQAFERVINMPPRGIGKKSIEKITEYAISNEISLYSAAQAMIDNKMLSAKALSGIVNFIEVVEHVSSIGQNNLTDIVVSVVELSKLKEYYAKSKTDKAQSKVENIEELVNATSDFFFDGDENSSVLVEFLTYAALESGKEERAESAVQLMTIHSSKGLEFPLVFITGLEENLFPHQLAGDDIDEERRLCYVGITRARKSLHLTSASKRRMYGREEYRQPSRFISEIPKSLIKDKSRNSISYNNKSFKDSFSQTSSSGYYIGQMVSHSKFGVGVITSLEGDGDKTRVQVNFNSCGCKWLMLSMSGLEKA